MHVTHLNKTEFTDIGAAKDLFFVPRIGWEPNIGSQLREG